MASTSRVFDRLAADLAARLAHPRTAPTVAGWVAAERALAGCRLASDTVAAGRPEGDPVAGRAALAALVRLAGTDPLAREAAFGALLRPLSVVAAELTGMWRADGEEVDQAVVAAGWEQLGRVAGATVLWPDWAVCRPARDRVRGRLRVDTRRRPVALDDPHLGWLPASAAEVGESVEVTDLLSRAVAAGVVTEDDVALLVEVRGAGVPAVEVAARAGRQPAAVRMQLARTEAALRAWAGPADRRRRLRLLPSPATPDPAVPERAPAPVSVERGA